MMWPPDPARRHPHGACRARPVQRQRVEGGQHSEGRGLARPAAGNGAKIVCFPELCTTPYSYYERNPSFFALAEPVLGPSVNRLCKVARETGTGLVYPLYAEIDPQVCDDVRDLCGFLKFRRPDAYRLVVGDVR